MSGSDFDADLNQIGQQAANLLKGAVGVVVGELQDFFSAGADAFVTFFEFLEQRGTLGETAMTFANVAKSCWRVASWRRAAARSSRAAATAAVRSSRRSNNSC